MPSSRLRRIARSFDANSRATEGTTLAAADQAGKVAFNACLSGAGGWAASDFCLELQCILHCTEAQRMTAARTFVLVIAQASSHLQIDTCIHSPHVVSVAP